MKSEMNLTDSLSRHIASYRDASHDTDLVDETKKRIADCLVAMMSGSTLLPGRVARNYAADRGGPGASTVAGTVKQTNSEMAAFANGMAAHADETDDANDYARIHPGASAVPAAVAIGEADNISGRALISAVVAGYEVGVAMVLAVWPAGTKLRQSIRSTHGVGQLFGATAAAASAATLKPDQIAMALSYSVQQCSGVATLFRDPEHIEKAFAMGGMQAHSGVRAVEFIRSGFTGVADVLDNSPSFFDSYALGGDPANLMRELSGRSHLLTTDMKQYPTGMPIQPAAEAMEAMVAEHKLRPEQVARIVCRLPSEKSRVVDNRPMPDINVQYILSVILSDGRLTFNTAHDYNRLQAPDIRDIMSRVELIHDTGLDPAPNVKGFTRCGIVEVTMKDGRQLVHRVEAALGSRKNPMGWPHMIRKAHAVLDDDFPSEIVDEMLEWVNGLDRHDSMRGISRFLGHPGTGKKRSHG